MDRTEATGLGVAFAGHAALLALLGLGFAATKMPPPKSTPIEIDLVTEEVALESTAPSPSAAAPAQLLAPIEGPPEPAPAPAPAPPVPQPAPMPRVEPAPQPQVIPPAPRPAPAPKAVQHPQPPQPRQVPKAVQRAQPARPAPAPRPVAAQPKAAPKAAAQPAQRSASGPTGRLKGLLSGLSAGDNPAKAASPPAQQAGPAVAASLRRAILQQLKPHWKAPTGADAEQLRTELSIDLAPSGAVTRVEVIRTTGQTASNRPQVKLHQEQAVRAVRLAAPFRLPSEYYDVWKHLSPIGFDKRLSQ